MRVTLKFEGDFSEIIKSRIHYSMSSVCFFNGWTMVDEGGDLRVLYGRTPRPLEASEFFVLASYRPLESSAYPPRPEFRMLSGNQVPIIHANDSEIDWLGEIFEWLSGAYEHVSGQFDSYGRLGFEGSLFARYNLTPKIPWASILINEFTKTLGKQSFVRVQKHTIIPSIDIDYVLNSIPQSVFKVLKTSLQHLYSYRNLGRTLESLLNLPRAISGSLTRKIFLDLMSHPELTQHLSIFVLGSQAHRRDAQFSISSVQQDLRSVQAKGADIGLHGSYESFVEGADLEDQKRRLQSAGLDPFGHRAHWLRFSHSTTLFSRLEGIHIKYDSSMGFSTHPGYRNGVSQPFVPYDLQNERPFSILEIPLVLMDATLMSFQHPRDEVQEVLTNGQKFGPMVASILWHDPFNAITVTNDLNRIFWEILNAPSFEKKSAKEIYSYYLQRARNAGLLLKDTNLTTE